LALHTFVQSVPTKSITHPSLKKISMTPFDFINDASFDKKNLMRGTENDAMAEKGYNPWLTNIAFSQHADSILAANLMNQYHFLDHRPQYEFFLNMLRPRKRFGKWPKRSEDDVLTLVCKTYQCSPSVGREYLKILTEEQLNEIRKQQEQGEVNNGRGRSNRKHGGNQSAK